ncbi:queuosine precursor transporter [Limnobacter litoralis]|uniref:Probable queuosine precursor transporter n=1 Tax=Limnobacter litoralis TaxID=481366 RepID=A0ABQ5YSL6_9BURK|nr:queuosine precursor transporter [Limnobacter litoralis]GLR27624.1 transporter [Limnobacter litoralis]
MSKVQPIQGNRSRQYKYYDFILAAFVVVLLCSNLIGPAKIAQLDLPLVGSVTFGAGVLFFPISYLYGDILTEVYGYGLDRRAVWAGFGGLIFASFMAWVVVHLPAAPFWQDRQAAIESVFGNTWRIVLASLVAFWSGSFANSFVLAKMKILTKGKHLWTRTIGSTLVGELVDSSLFYTIAFWGIMTKEQLITVTLTQYVLKTGWEVVATPLTYWIVASLKRAENEDYYDTNTSFNPFTLKA